MLRHRRHQFEAEQSKLHQQLAELQKELTMFKQQYESLLEQVGQQHSLIQQLSESQETQKAEEKVCHMESEDKEGGGECKPEPDFFMKHWCYFNLNTHIYSESSLMVSPEEAGPQIDDESTVETSTNTESLPVKEQLSPMMCELGDTFRYCKFHTTCKFSYIMRWRSVNKCKCHGR